MATLASLPNGTPVAPAAPPNVAPEDVFLRMTPAQRAVILGLLASYYGFVLYTALPDLRPGQGQVLIALGLCLFAAVLPVIFYRPTMGWLHPLVFMPLAGLNTILRAFPSYAEGMRWHLALPDLLSRELNETLALKLSLLALASVCTYIGYGLYRRPFVPTLTFSRPVNLRGTTVLFLVIAGLILGAMVFSMGGPGAYALALSRGRHAALEGRHYLLLPVYFAGAAWWCWVAHSSKSDVRRLDLWLIGAAILGVTGAATFSRSLPVLFLSIAFVIVTLSRRQIFLVRGALLVFVAIYFVTVTGEIRRSSWRGELDWSAGSGGSVGETLQSGWSRELTSRVTTADSSLAVLARVPRQVGLLYGESYIAGLLVPVPRSLWPGKPGLIDGRVGRTFYQTNGGMPIGGATEAFWNFHVPGVIVVYLLLGMALRVLAAWLRTYPQQPTIIALYVVPLFAFGPRSSSWVVFGQLWIPLFLILFGLGAFRFGRASPDTPARAASTPTLAGGQKT